MKEGVELDQLTGIHRLVAERGLSKGIFNKKDVEDYQVLNENVERVITAAHEVFGHSRIGRMLGWAVKKVVYGVREGVTELAANQSKPYAALLRDRIKIALAGNIVQRILCVGDDGCGSDFHQTSAIAIELSKTTTESAASIISSERSQAQSYQSDLTASYLVDSSLDLIDRRVA